MSGEAVPREVWLQVLERDNYQCQCCGTEGGEEDFHPHHYTKRSKSGADEKDNLVTLCYKCHRAVEEHAIHMKRFGGVFYFSRRKRWG